MINFPPSGFYVDPTHSLYGRAYSEMMTPTSFSPEQRRDQKCFLNRILDQLGIPQDDQSAIRKMFGEQGLEAVFQYLRNDFPQSLLNCKRLNLSSLQLESLPKQIKYFPNLTRLDLELNSLNSLPPLPLSLTTLRLRNNNFEIIPQEVQDLPLLQTFSMQENLLTSLDGIIEVKSLIKGIFSRNSITSLPENIGNLDQLEELYLTSNQIETLPNNFDLDGRINYILNDNPIALPGSNVQQSPIQITRGQRRDQEYFLNRILEQLNFHDYYQSAIRKMFGEQGLEAVFQYLQSHFRQSLMTCVNLDLSNLQLESLPEQIQHFPNLNQLNLRSNHLASLPSLPPLLTTLQLRGNKFKTIPQEVQNLPLLEEISMQGNFLTSLEGLIEMKSLERAIFAHNKISSLPGNIEELKKLKTLILTRNCIKTIPSSFWNLNITKCNLNHNPLNTDDIQNIKTLINNTLLADKIFIQNSTNLTPEESPDIFPNYVAYYLSLDVQNPTNNLTSKQIRDQKYFLNNVLDQLKIPQAKQSAIQNIFKEKGLEVVFQCLTSYFPHKLLRCIKLTLSNLQLESLPEQIQYFPNLRRLDLKINHLSALPPLPPSLTTLRLNNNVFETIPQEVQSLPLLEEFSMQCNRLISLDGLTNIKNLKTANFGDNKISSLPEDIDDLDKLQELYLRNNCIEILPDRFWGLNITKGNLNQNPLNNNLHEQITNLIDENASKNTNGKKRKQVEEPLPIEPPHKKRRIISVSPPPEIPPPPQSVTNPENPMTMDPDLTNWITWGNTDSANTQGD